MCEFYKCDNCESNWLSRNTSGTLGWDSPIYRATSPDLLHACCSTAAIMTSSLAGVRTDREWPAFSNTVGITRPVSRRRRFKRRNTLLSDWRRQNNEDQAPVHPCQLEYCKLRGRNACCRIRGVCIPESFGNDWAVLYTERLDCTEQRALWSRQTTLQIYGDVYSKLNTSGHTLRNITNGFLTINRTLESLWVIHFTYSVATLTRRSAGICCICFCYWLSSSSLCRLFAFRASFFLVTPTNGLALLLQFRTLAESNIPTHSVV